jgi:hypothetical protein
MAEEAKLGIDSKIYRNTGNWASPVWVEIDLVSDFTINASWNKASYTTRRSRVEVSKKTTLNLTVSGKIRADDDDDGFHYLYDGFLSEDPVDLLILNGPNDQDDVYGWRCEWYVDQANEDQGLQTVLFEDFTLTPADEENSPQSVLIVSSSPVYTELAPAA